MKIKYNVGYIFPSIGIDGKYLKGYFLVTDENIDWYGQYTKGFCYKITAKIYCKLMNYIYKNLFLCCVDTDKWTWNQYNLCYICSKAKK